MKGNVMKRIITILIIAIISQIVFAQTGHDTPPAGHLDSCEAVPIMYDYFGPHCLNPVTWNLSGFISIDTVIDFVREDGTTDMGLVMGYRWNPFEERYLYYVRTQMPFGNFMGAFEDVPPERVIQ